MITELDHNVFAALSQVGQTNPSLLLDIIKTVSKVTQTVVGEDWKKDCDAEGLLAVLVQSLMNAGDSRRAIASKRNGKNHKKKGKCAGKTTQDTLACANNDTQSITQDDLGCTQSVVANTTQDTLAYTLGYTQSTTQSDLACTKSDDKSEAKVCLGCTQNITQDTLGYALGCTLNTTQDDLACTINHTQRNDKVRQSNDKVSLGYANNAVKCDLGAETVDLTAKNAENAQESVAKAQEPTRVQLTSSINNNAEQSDVHADVCEEGENADFERRKEEKEKYQKKKKKGREYIAYTEGNRGVGEEETRFAVYDNCEDVLQLEQMLNRNGDAQAYYAYLDAKKQREVKQDTPSPQNGKIIKRRSTRAAEQPDIPESFDAVKVYFDEHRAPDAQGFYAYWEANEWRDKKGPVKSWKGRAATWIRNNGADIPTLQQVHAYCIEKNNYVDAREFFAHYNSAGWKIGREYIRNWRSKVDEWACGEKAKKRKRDAENAPKYERF